MASALRRAAEAAGKTEFENPPTGQASATPTSAGSGAAAAPARARESKVTPIESKIGTAKTASGKADESEQSAAEVWQAHSAAVKAEASEFATLDDTRDALAAQQSSGKGGSKKGLVVAVVLLGVAAAGYFGWTKMQSRQAQPVQQSVAPAQTSLSLAASSPGDCGAGSSTFIARSIGTDGTDLDRVRTSIIFKAIGRSPIRNCRFQDGISGGKTGWNRQPCDSAQSSRSRDPSAVRAAVGKKR